MKRSKIVNIRKNYLYEMAEPNNKWWRKVKLNISLILIFVVSVFKLIAYYSDKATL